MGEDRIYFAHPAVFDIKCSECCGNTLYHHAMDRIKTFLRADVLEDLDEEELRVTLFIKREDGEERVSRNGQQIEASNASRNTTTITVIYRERISNGDRSGESSS